MEHGVHRQLLGIGTPVLGVIHQLVGREIHILQALKEPSVNDVGLDNVLNILGVNLHIGCIVRHDPHNRTLGTKAKAAGCDNVNTATQSIICNDPDKIVNDLQATRTVARRATATQNLNMGIPNQAIGRVIIIMNVMCRSVLHSVILFHWRVVV